VYRFGGPAERAGRPEGYSCCGVVEGRSAMTRGHLKETRRRWARCVGCVEVVGGPGVSGGDLAALGGRPLLGGCATCTSGGEKHGFSLSVESLRPVPGGLLSVA
jgi:hypothetical protein